MLLLFEMVKRIPRRRNKSRTGLPQYPLSPTMRSGRSLGRPLPGRLTPPLESRASTTLASWLWPGVNTSAIKRPWRSVRRWTLVLKPPLLRPRASAAAFVFLPQPHVGGHAQPSHPRSGLPNRSAPVHLLHSVTDSRSDPKCLLLAIDRSGWRRLTKSHIVPACRARVRLSAAPIRYHSQPGDGRDSVAQSSAFAPVAALLAVAIVRHSVLLF